MSRNLPWFRLYTEAVDDDRLRLLAFEDRWHFVAILCCKGAGLLDDAGDLLHRRLAVKLGVQVRELEEIGRRLSEVGLIEKDTFQPVAWEIRQFKSDTDPTAGERKRRQRNKQKQQSTGVTRDVTDVSRTCHGRVTRTDTDTDTDTEKSEKKNTRVAVAPLVSVRNLFPEADEQHLRDWLSVRKSKRLPMTPTAARRFRSESQKAGLSVAAAVQLCAERGWAGLNAEWVSGAQNATGYKPLPGEV